MICSKIDVVFVFKLNAYSSPLYMKKAHCRKGKEKKNLCKNILINQTTETKNKKRQNKYFL